MAKADEIYHVETTRERVSLFYQRLYFSFPQSVGLQNGVRKFMDRLEELGIYVSEEGGTDRIVSDDLPDIVKLSITRNELKAAKHVIVEAVKPGSRQQVAYGIQKTKLLPFCSDLGIRQKVEQEAFGSGESDREDEALTDTEIEEKKRKDEDEKTKKASEEKKEDKK